MTPEELAMLQAMQQQQIAPLPSMPQQMPQMPMAPPMVPPPPATQQPLPPSAMQGMQEYWPQQQQLGFQPPPGLAPMSYPPASVPLGQPANPQDVMRQLSSNPQVGMVVNPYQQTAFLPHTGESFDLNDPRGQGYALDWAQAQALNAPPSAGEFAAAKEEKFEPRGSPQKQRRMAKGQKQTKRKLARGKRMASKVGEVGKRDPTKLSAKQAKEHRLERAKLAKKRMAERRPGGRRGESVGSYAKK